MKQIQYLSPTSIAKFKEDRSEFYMMYLADRRPPKIPQTRPMSVGSAFDAHAKSWIHERLFGRGYDPKFDLVALFEAQVESQNRDWAMKAGAYTFQCYQASGALEDLMLELRGASNTPRFEFEVRGAVNGQREAVEDTICSVHFLGKPDVHFVNRDGAHCILDWKVNGYCSSYTTTPMQGYVRLRERGDDGRWRNSGQHRGAQVMAYRGMQVNVSNYLENYNEDWARQLSIYAWLVGMQVGSQFIAAIDQLACKPGGAQPQVRVAEHRLRISETFQWRVMREAKEVWEVVHSDHFFRDMTKEASQARCRLLDGTADALAGEGSANDKWFSEACRGS